MKKKYVGIILAVVVIVGSLSFLLFGQLEKNIVYFVTPSELLAKGDQAFNQSVRLGGMVKKGSIDWQAETTTLHFLITDGKQDLSVTSKSAPPQMFQEEMGVVVEGKLAKGVGPLPHTPLFVAERLMVKHSNEYHPPKEGQKPVVIYKDLVK